MLLLCGSFSQRFVKLMFLILTAIGGRPNPDICFFPERLK